MTDALETAEAAEPFLTIADLQVGHAAFLRSYRAGTPLEKMGHELKHFVTRAQRSGAFLFEPGSRLAAQGYIDYWSTMLYRASMPIEDVVLDEYDPSLAPAVPCPYVGLEAFGEKDRKYFFGRKQIVRQALEKLRTRRLIAVLGPSGSGKSSIVRAGLLPRLKAGVLSGGASWRYLEPIVPGSNPLKSLAAALRTDGIEELAAKLRSDSSTLRRIADEGSVPLVVTIDQFEELFTLCEDNAVQAAFVNNLTNLLKSDGRHIVIVAMRSDRDAYLARFPELQRLFATGDIRATALNRDELREAIEGPARKVNVHLERGLSDALVEELVGETAALPLLQFTLWKLWEARVGNWIPMAAYTKLGGGRAALGNAGHKLFESMAVQSQETMRRIMLRMVRPGIGEETTSSRVRVQDVLQIGDDPERVQAVLRRLVDERLVRRTTGGAGDDEQVEVAHEALIRNWPELVKWVEEKKAELIDLRRLEAIADQWDRRGRVSGFLDERQLKEAEDWLASPEVEEIGVKPTLLALVAASRVRVMQRQWILRLLVVIMIVALAFAWYRERLATIAERDERTAERGRKAAENALTSAKLATVERQLTESQRIQTLLSSSSSSDAKFTEYQRTIVDPLNAKIAELEKQLAGATRPTSTQAAQQAATIQNLEKERTGLRKTIDDQIVQIANMTQTIGRLENQLEKVPKPVSHPHFKGVLRLTDLVSSARGDAAAAGIGAFFEDDGRQFIMTTAGALPGDPGEVVLHRAPNGVDSRIGIVWEQIGEGRAAAGVALLYPDVEIDPTLPSADSTKPKTIQGPSPWDRVGNEVQIIGKVDTIRGKIKSINASSAEIEAPLTPVYLGAPVLDRFDLQIGVVSDVTTDQVTIRRLRPILSAYDASLIVKKPAKK